jgi:hypothetical protein
MSGSRKPSAEQLWKAWKKLHNSWYNCYTARFDFDPRKSQLLRNNPRRGIGFEEAKEIFARPYYLDRSSDFPEQYRAVG